MRLKIEAVTKESKESPRGERYWGVKSGETWFNLKTDKQPRVGDVLDVDVKETEYKGKIYRWATINETQPEPTEEKRASASPASTRPTWTEVKIVLREAHFIALELEPDVESGADRAAARAAIVNTVIIAFTKQGFDLDLPDAADDVPF